MRGRVARESSTTSLFNIVLNTSREYYVRKKMNFDEDKDIVRIDEKEAKSVLGTEVVDSYIHLMKDMGRLSTSWITKATTKHSFIKFLDTLSGLAVFGKNKIVKKAMAEGKGRSFVGC